MDNLFSCNPNCSISNLDFWDWAVAVSFFIVIYLLTTLVRKWVFSRSKYPETSIKWHVPRFIFIALICAIVTIPIAWSIFGHFGAKIFGKFIYPETAIIVYFAWLFGTEKHNESAKK